VRRRVLALVAAAFAASAAASPPALGKGLFSGMFGTRPPEAGPRVLSPPVPRLRPKPFKVAKARPKPLPAGVSGEIVGSIAERKEDAAADAGLPVAPPARVVGPPGSVPPPVIGASPVVGEFKANPAGAPPAAAVAPPPAAEPVSPPPPAPPPAAATPPPKIMAPAAALPPVVVTVKEPGEDLDPGGDLASPFAIELTRPTVVPGAAKPEPLGDPYKLVRVLQLAQDRIAQGSTDALAEQRDIRARLDTGLPALDDAVWQDKRNAQAAVTYVLSGGAPNVLKHMKTIAPYPPIDPNLVDGVLAYIEGNESEASRLLGPINAFDLPPSMGGLVAMAQSALVVRSDPQKAMHLLDVARLLSPGSLVEEAALRRELLVADSLKDGEEVETLGRLYLQRFRHSVYAGRFRNLFAAAISRLDLARHPEQSGRLDEMLASVEPAAQCQLYLTLALASLTKGNALAAGVAASRAAALAPSGSAEEARARLYRAAAGVADADKFDQTSAEMARIDRDKLSASDRSLYMAVAATIDGVKSGTDVPDGPAPAPEETDAKLNPLYGRAADALKAADTLLAVAK